MEDLVCVVNPALNEVAIVIATVCTLARWMTILKVIMLTAPAFRYQASAARYSGTIRLAVIFPGVLPYWAKLKDF